MSDYVITNGSGVYIKHNEFSGKCTEGAMCCGQQEEMVTKYNEMKAGMPHMK